MSRFFENKIKEKRENAGLTQKQLSMLIGVDESLISKYESGECVPTYEKILSLADIFHISSEEIMGVKTVSEEKYNENGERIINIENGQVVRRQFMSCVNDDAVVLTPDGIRFSTQCVRKWEETDHIHLIIDEDMKLLVVRRSDEDDPDSQRWSSLKDGKKYGRKITGREFASRLYRMMKWSKGFTHRISGYTGVNEADPTEKLWYFELSEAEATPIMEKSRIKMGVKDSELETKDLENIKRIENEREEERKKRNEIKEKGGNPGPVRIVLFYPDTWGQYSFGVPVKEHVKRPQISIEEGL